VTELPSGTVTFLFTDVEGSTRLLLEHGERYVELLAAHRRAIRAAIAAHAGVPVGTEGDAVFAAFASAGDAVAAAADAQAALANGPVAVRMGIHTGTPLLTEEGYVGIDVHRAARIAAAGHGGQVLLSRATRELVDADVRDLGAHRLKDLATAERIYQLGDREHPPLKTLAPTNLPVPASPFLGREQELGEAVEQLARDDVRLFTLTGPGGTGKTRLALQVAGEAAGRYADGVFWVALAGLRDARLVLDAVAQAVGAKRSLGDHIGGRHMLLVLDNFEHVLEAAAGVADLLVECPGIDVLVTSREALHIAGEWEYRVDPLAEREAVAFFAQRARAVERDVELGGVAEEICRRLDCLPLALELAAARVKALAPPALLERLRRNVPVLATAGRDAPERQRTLRATIAWSHDLLDEPERALFARMSVFAGGATLDAVEEICGGDLDTLASLVDKSLVRRSGERYWMLETVREYAAEMLEATGDADAARGRHAEWFSALAEKAHLRRRDAAAAHSMARLDDDHDNLRAALAWALERPGGDLAWRLTGALWLLWFVRGYWAEGRRWLDATLARGRPDDERLLVAPLWGAALLALWQRDLAAAWQAVTRMEAVVERLDDVGGRAAASHLYGMLCGSEGRIDEARAATERSVALAREVGDRWLEGASINNLGDFLMNEGDLEAAARHFEISLAIAREDGDPYRISLALSNLAELALDAGDLGRARTLTAQVLRIARAESIADQIAAGLLVSGLVALPEDPSAGVRLIAAADRLLLAEGSFHQPYERAQRDAGLAAGRARLGAEAFDAAYVAGGAAGLEEAIDAALAAGAPPDVTPPVAR
jgi:predicted ATPase/class 3 adenylate cyclase